MYLAFSEADQNYTEAGKGLHYTSRRSLVLWLVILADAAAIKIFSGCHTLACCVWTGLAADSGGGGEGVLTGRFSEGYEREDERT